jgi:dipeptidyl-peptidase-4
MIKKLIPQILLITITIQVFSQKGIQLEDIFSSYKFFPQSVSGLTSMADGKHFSVIDKGIEIAVMDYEKGVNKEVIFSLKENPIPGESQISSYEFSDNESKILFSTSKEYIYRHTFLTSYYLYDRNTKELIPVYDKKQQFAKISPDGNSVAFVVDNNLFLKDIKTKKAIQITHDGLKTRIINGMPDWVYEEEFSLKNAFEWSPDSRQIAFYRFDESNVKEFQLTLYQSLYPDYARYKYPKAGEENSIVTINVYDVVNQKHVVMDTGNETDIYIPRIKWTAHPNKLCIVRLNRLQNKAELLMANTITGGSEVFYMEEDDRFISEFSDDFATFLKDGKHVLIMSEKDGYMHFYLYSESGELLHQITKGNWEVDEFYGVDEKNKMIYFSSTEISPLERHIYRIRYDGKGKKQLSSSKGSHRAVFSSTFDYYIDYFSESNKPLNVVLKDRQGKSIRNLETNQHLQRLTEEHNFTQKEFLEFKGPSGDMLYGFIYKPKKIDDKKKYPVLIYVYGGPESQDVTDSWDRNQPWFQYLAQQGYVVACIDNRGTNGRGEAFKKATYMQLGKHETEDQIAFAEYLSSMDFIDKNRIGIFGWSYGGYMTLLCLMKGSHIFKMGVAVAPVTNWRFYDTIYTERFMRKPQDNADGYDSNSPINHVEKLNGKLLLVHGTADDNVHIQNSMLLVDELVQHNKDFDMYFYPNKNHGIYGGNTRLHLFSQISKYVFDNL